MGQLVGNNERQAAHTIVLAKLLVSEETLCISTSCGCRYLLVNM